MCRAGESSFKLEQGNNADIRLKAQTLWSLYEKVRPSTLKLTKLDDEIYQHMEEAFPDLRVTDEDKSGGVSKVDEDKMKSPKGKQEWRNFIQTYEGKGE
jgi:hypothetical protein